jgi:putative membrane protein
VSTGLGPVTVAGAVEPRQRLHPLSPLLHSAKTLAALVAAISIQGFVQLGWRGFLGTVVIVMCFAVAYSVAAWLVTGYHVVGRELRVYDGVLVRRTRAIPLERLQAVEVVRPLLARLAGLAELRLEVVGGGKTEAPLAFLTVADAAALRERLLMLAARRGAATLTGPPGPGGAPGPAGVPTPPAGVGATGTAPTAAPGAGPPYPGAAAPAPPAARAPERPLHTVINREVLVSQLLTPQVIFLPFAVAFVVAQSWFEGGAWSLVVVASTAAAIVGVVQQPVRRIMSDWNFRLALQEPPPGKRHPGLRLRHGLTETRSQTVPLNRVQAVGVTWPLLWRHRRWLRCRLDVAGYAPPQQGGGTSDRLLPVGDLATARRLTAVVLPGVDLLGLRLTGPPRRARWVAPLRRPVLGVALTDQVVATRDGRITRELVVVPYQRVQSVRVVQGPLQRWLGLATVFADTAGALTAAAHHRELAEARWLAAELTARARVAREAEQAEATEQAEAEQAEATDRTPPADPTPTGPASTDRSAAGPAGPADPVDPSGLSGRPGPPPSGPGSPAPADRAGPPGDDATGAATTHRPPPPPPR